MSTHKNKAYAYVVEFPLSESGEATTPVVWRFTRINMAKAFRERTLNSYLIAMEEDLTQLTNTQLVNLYNLAKPEEKVTRFSSKGDGAERTWPLLPNISQTGLKTTPKEPGKRGRPSRFKEMRIMRNVAENPRRPGTHGHKAWELIVDGMTFEEYMVAAKDVPGGPLKHLRWCHHHNFVSFE